jgi:hypothetical protein
MLGIGVVFFELFGVGLVIGYICNGDFLLCLGVDLKRGFFLNYFIRELKKFWMYFVIFIN